MIARKGAAGTSCTWVAIRFMSLFPNQPTRFEARVYLFEISEVEEILTSYLTKYWRATGKDLSDDDDEEDKRGFVKDFNEVNSILTTLMALFCDQEEFSCHENTRAFLDQAESEDDAGIVKPMVEWAEALLAKHLEGKEAVSVQASTTADLLFKLQPYMYQLSPEEGGGVIPDPWPLVRTIDIGMDHDLLNQGIVIVDVPGRSDSNTTRTANAIRHQRECLYWIVVAEIARAEDDTGVREMLQNGYNRRGSGHTMLILTRADEIDAQTTVSGPPEDQAKKAELVKNISALKTKRAELTNKCRGLSREEMVDEKPALDAVGNKLNETLNQLDVLRLNMRSRKVSREISNIYRKLTGDIRPLPVFPIGNEDYELHQAGYCIDDKDQPKLSVRETGVPDLRHHVFGAPAEAKLSAALHMANVVLPNAINSFELYCNKTHMARRSEIEAVILEPHQKLPATVASAFDRIKASVNELVLNPMKVDEANWNVQARRLCKKWAMINRTGPHLALLKKSGFKKGRGKGAADTNWNRELANIQRVQLERAFGTLQTSILPVFTDLTREVVQLLESTRVKIKNDRQFNLMALQPFLQSFTGEKPMLNTTLESAYRNLGTAIGYIFENCTMSSGVAYIDQAMAPIYAEVRQIKGSGAPPKRLDRFERMVTKQDGVWMTVHDRASAELDSLFARFEKRILTKIGEQFDRLHNKFNLLCDNSEIKSEAEKEKDEKLRAEAQIGLVKAKDLLEGKIREHADTCKRYSGGKEEDSLFISQT